MRSNRDLAAAVAAAVLCALLAVVIPWEGLRLLAALPLAFVLPGYAILAAAFGPRRLESTHSIMLSLGCSLAVLCLGGLILNYVPGGIQTASWAILLAVVVVAACAVGALRRRREDPAEGEPPVRRRLRPRPIDVVCGVVVVALTVGAIGLANTPLPAGKAGGFTSLWILPTGAGEKAVQLGVSSSEGGQRRYVLEIQVGEGQPKTVARLALRPGDERAFTVPVDVSRGESTLVSGLLYRQSNPITPLRKVRIWLPPAGR
jgi:uncharacterized membrane protein